MSIFALTDGDVFWHSETLLVEIDETDSFTMEINTKLTVLSVRKDEIDFIMEHAWINPLKLVIIESTAKYRDGMYVFNGIDNWENKVFGNFSVKGKNMTLFFDSKELTNEGKNNGGMFGGSHILDKTAECVQVIPQSYYDRLAEYLRKLDEGSEPEKQETEISPEPSGKSEAELQETAEEEKPVVGEYVLFLVTAVCLITGILCVIIRKKS